MSQVFESFPSLTGSECILQEIWKELEQISLQCPDGEKTFERLLQLLQQLVEQRDEQKTLASHHHGNVHQTVEWETTLMDMENRLAEAKERSRLCAEQLLSAEEENEKVLEEKKDQDEVIKSLRKQLQQIQVQENDQIQQLREQLFAEQQQTQLLKQIARLNASRNSESSNKVTKSLKQELKEVCDGAETKELETPVLERNGVASSAVEKRLQIVHLHANNLMPSSPTTPRSNKNLGSVKLPDLNYMRFLLLLLVCFSTGLFTVDSLLVDDIFQIYFLDSPPV